jgi:hypothetical protein
MNNTPNQRWEELKKLAVSVEGAAVVADSSRTAIFEAIRKGELKARKHGRRTIILMDDLQLYLQQLPIVAG